MAVKFRELGRLGGHPFALKLVANNALQVPIEDLDLLLMKDATEVSVETSPSAHAVRSIM